MSSLKSIVLLLVPVLTMITVSFVSCNSEKETEVRPVCETLCNESSAEKNLPLAFLRVQQCCNESIECPLHENFYRVDCIKQFMEMCSFSSTERTKLTNLKRWNTSCCDVNFSTDNSTNSTECPSVNIPVIVEWKNVSFDRENDNLTKIWKAEYWEFFLKMVSQRCLKSTRREQIVYQYPSYASIDNYEKKLVYAFVSPQTYLVMRLDRYTLFTVISDSFRNVWVLLALSITTSMISGIIIWLLERRKNPLEFPSSFWQGFREGTWWALVTMTTVGYGDKSPKSFLARVYSAAWMILGIIILSAFTAEVSSGLTSKYVRQQGFFLGKEIAVPVFSKTLFERELKGASIIEKDSFHDLKKHVLNKERGHKSVLHEGCYPTNEPLQAVRALGSYAIGISAKSGSRFRKCVREMAEKQFGSDETLMEQSTSVPQRCQNSNHKIKKGEHEKKQDFDPFQLSLCVLYILNGILVTVVIVGTAWDMIMAKKQQKRKKEAVDDSGSCRISIPEGDGNIDIAVAVTED
ncbi:uncharacterized protein [Montipora capricornis]|uniref:uncharacterized protein n=1 Tax=Montipora capricornis TaxID=246305 RepID=UPI0035F12643